MYSGRIRRQQGGSEMSLASGASLNFESGAQLGGTIGGNPTFADRPVFSTGPTISVGGAASIAASGLKLGAEMAASGTATWEGVDFGNGLKLIISLAASRPSPSASPGSLMIHRSGPTGSGARLYINTSNDDGVSETGGSTWTVVKLALASS